uniref:SANT domain-containing protein n=1 Tax=Anisakis simplex TaxID=6269 RepID=A0A0M3K4P7_ANISI
LNASVSTTSTTNNNTSTTTTTQQSSSNNAKTTRKWGQWNNTETSLFYEGIKQFGKDFDQIAKLMSRRKMNKDKEQIRNYYFNSFKLLRSIVMIDESLLFRSLLFYEHRFFWNIRTEYSRTDVKFLLDSFLFRWTSVKRKKKPAVPIRTPVCPALQKLFPSCQKAEQPLPSHIFIYLSPKNESDRNYVESCGQNALIRIKLLLNDQLKSIFKLLKIKWTHPLQKAFDDVDSSWKGSSFSVSIFPDKSTRLGRLYVRHVEDSGSNIFSMNRLRKERIQRCADDTDEHSNHSDSATTARLTSACDAAHSGHLHSNNIADANQEITNMLSKDSTKETNSFILNEVTLRAGLNENSVGDATVTELFYICGMEQNISLQYSINRPKNRDVQPWNVFVSLITRNYGENFAKIMAEPESTDEVQPVMVTVEDRSRKRRTSSSNSNDTNNCTTSSNATSSQKTALSSTSKSIAIINAHSTENNTSAADNNSNVNSNQCAPVVESENNAFMLQLESLQTKKRCKAYTQRTQPKRIALPRNASNNTNNKNNIYGSGSHNIAYTNNRFDMVTNVNVSNSLVTSANLNDNNFCYQNAVDFSSIAPSTSIILDNIASQHQNIPADLYQLQPSAVSSAVAQQHDEYSPNEVIRLNNSDPSAAPLNNYGVYHPGANNDTNRNKTLTELSAVDLVGANSSVSAATNSVSLDMSPFKGNSSLPEDVKYSFEMMMQQNSIDYCRNFEQLLTSIDTPKKVHFH